MMAPRPSVESERRQQIIDAAMMCFARNGYHVTTMDDIAEQLPFSKGLLYYYFKTKRDLFLAILDDWMARAMAEWGKLLQPGAPAAEQLGACLTYGMQLLTQSAELSRVEFEFYGELGRDPTISEAYRSLFAAFRAEFKTILEMGIKRGELRSVNADAVAAVLLAIYEGLALQAVSEPEGFDWSAVAQEISDMVMRGIAAPSD
jgi:AcrR family transcriptional regulator